VGLRKSGTPIVLSILCLSPCIPGIVPSGAGCMRDREGLDRYVTIGIRSIRTTLGR
jgi:hypothetical protein